MARSGTTLSNVVISNTSGITANILFQPGQLKTPIWVFVKNVLNGYITLFRIGIDSKSNWPNSSNVHGIRSSNDRQGLLERDKLVISATECLTTYDLIWQKDLQAPQSCSDGTSTPELSKSLDHRNALFMPCSDIIYRSFFLVKKFFSTLDQVKKVHIIIADITASPIQARFKLNVELRNVFLNDQSNFQTGSSDEDFIQFFIWLKT